MKFKRLIKSTITYSLLLIATIAFTQNNLLNAKIFFKNGGQIEGQIKPNFQNKEKLEVNKNGK
jgi:hypothetical protein